ncbi:MAG: fumarylacetoacetate hydrolase family protein [Candidatus Korobacteraceae bacterium]|jgi:2-keto-4-pentenoate hydratase/2-oxohepta-3-ene-1,7-dioic acid hydratase in catechol pathway
MQYCRFQYQDATRYGLIEDVAGRPTITRTLGKAPQSFSDFERGEMSELQLSAIRQLAPAEPGKIVCIGRNYREHAKELDHPIPTEPLIFLKPPSSLIGPGDEIRRPAELSQRVDYEGELGVVIGRRCYCLRESDDVKPYVVGYTCVNDVTARDLQNKDGQWTRAKGFDTFCPVGPVVAEGLDPWKGVRVQSRVNGELRQNGTTADFLFPLDVLVRFISQVMTLEPGDVIATGTPAGVGPLKAGDAVEVTVEGVGTLSNPVVDRP